MSGNFSAVVLGLRAHMTMPRFGFFFFFDSLTVAVLELTVCSRLALSSQRCLFKMFVSQVLGSKPCCHYTGLPMPDFYVGTENPISGPQISMPDTVSAEPSLLSCISFFFLLFFILCVYVHTDTYGSQRLMGCLPCCFLALLFEKGSP